jgi:hypothetical protein
VGSRLPPKNEVSMPVRLGVNDGTSTSHGHGSTATIIPTTSRLATSTLCGVCIQTGATSITTRTTSPVGVGRTLKRMDTA